MRKIIQIKVFLLTGFTLLNFGNCSLSEVNKSEINFNSHKTIEKSSKEKEYEIYLKILDDNEKVFVILNQTMNDPILEHSNSSKYITERIKEEFNELKSDTLENFILKNKQSIPIEKKFIPQNKFKLVEKEVLEPIWKNSSKFTDFKEKYSTKGYYTFSQVGFSDYGTQAILFRSIYCGSLCASGDYFLLSKKNENWQITRTFNAWVS